MNSSRFILFASSFFKIEPFQLTSLFYDSLEGEYTYLPTYTIGETNTNLNELPNVTLGFPFDSRQFIMPIQGELFL